MRSIGSIDGSPFSVTIDQCQPFSINLRRIGRRHRTLRLIDKILFFWLILDLCFNFGLILE
ncbi:hypothetical protein M6B38_175755 [Iris pallida]|nr:hypothetical protein M6B38_175750 [Iris pallida]KAJ6806278.1 hypothetical protein M6B38_175755 [Iris pallida]